MVWCWLKSAGQVRWRTERVLCPTIYCLWSHGSPSNKIKHDAKHQWAAALKLSVSLRCAHVKWDKKCWTLDLWCKLDCWKICTFCFNSVQRAVLYRQYASSYVIVQMYINYIHFPCGSTSYLIDAVFLLLNLIRTQKGQKWRIFAAWTLVHFIPKEGGSSHILTG